MLVPLLTRADLCGILRVGASTLYSRLRAGQIPEPIRIGGSTSHPRWRADVIEAWLAQQHGGNA